MITMRGVFKPRALPKATSEAAYLSYGAVIIFVLNVDAMSRTPPPMGIYDFLAFYTISRLFNFYFFLGRGSHIFFTPKLFFLLLCLSISGCFWPFGTLFRHGSKFFFIIFHNFFFHFWMFFLCLQHFSAPGSKKFSFTKKIIGRHVFLH